MPVTQVCEEKYKSLRIVRDTNANGLPTVKIWRGKVSKPFAYYRFDNEAKREVYIDLQRKAEDGRESAKIKRKAENDQQIAAFVDSVNVGTIFCYSWGYEQTNIEFFQCVAKKNRKITLREIDSVLFAAPDCSPMAGYCSPMRDHFIGREFTKIISPWGISMPHGCCTPTTQSERHYFSWYA